MQQCAFHGHLEVLQCLRLNGMSLGTQLRAAMRRGMVISRCCNGPEPKDVPGMNGLADMRLLTVIKHFCSGPNPKDVHATNRLADMRDGLRVCFCFLMLRPEFRRSTRAELVVNITVVHFEIVFVKKQKTTRSNNFGFVLYKNKPTPTNNIPSKRRHEGFGNMLKIQKPGSTFVLADRPT